MASSASLTCNFTIKTSLGVGVSFQSDNNGANYGGQITIFTPGTAGPVTTGLWDSDGNVYFTIYEASNPSLSCTINSGSNPGSWTPYVVVAREAGLTCSISGPQQSGESSYDYTLTISSAAAEAQGAAAAAAPALLTADLVLPVGGKEAWTQIMYGSVAVPDKINTGSPIVMAWARFGDGTSVAGGVYKSGEPTDYNVKFMWVMDPRGNQYPGWLIDVSDDQDFLQTSYDFALTPGGEPTHQLNIVEGGRTMELSRPVTYNFAIGLFDATTTPGELLLWESGTMTLDTSATDAVTGVLTVPNYLSDAIPFKGSPVCPGSDAGTMIVASGESPQAQISLAFAYNYDGFLCDDTYFGGLLSIYVHAAQETYLYVIQGLAGQSPFGAAFRGTPGAADKRKA